MGGSSETGGVTASKQAESNHTFFKRGWVSGRDAQTSTTGIVTVPDGAGRIFSAPLLNSRG